MSVYGTDAGSITRSFSRRLSIARSGLPKKSLPRVSGSGPRIFLKPLPTRLKALFHQYSALAFLSLRRSNSHRQSRNVDRVSIAYASRPRLRVRLTPGGRTCPGKPRDSGDRDSHPVFRYSCPHNHCLRVHRRLRSGFGHAGTLLYHLSIRDFGTQFDSRSFSARDHSTSQLLRTV